MVKFAANGIATAIPKRYFRIMSGRSAVLQVPKAAMEAAQDAAKGVNPTEAEDKDEQHENSKEKK